MIDLVALIECVKCHLREAEAFEEGAVLRLVRAGEMVERLRGEWKRRGGVTTKIWREIGVSPERGALLLRLAGAKEQIESYMKDHPGLVTVEKAEIAAGLRNPKEQVEPTGAAPHIAHQESTTESGSTLFFDLETQSRILFHPHTGVIDRLLDQFGDVEAITAVEGIERLHWVQCRLKQMQQHAESIEVALVLRATQGGGNNP